MGGTSAMSKRQHGLIAGCLLLAVLLGIVIGVAVPYLLQGRVSTSWRPVIVGSHHFGESFATEAIFTDVPAPDLLEFAGRAKFVDDIFEQPADPELGYDLTAKMAEIPRGKIPYHYLHPKPVVINGITTATAPPDHFYYSWIFEFTLRDKDGFELLKVQSKPSDLISGTTNNYKDKAAQRVPFAVARRTASIEVAPEVVKCFTCSTADASG